MKKLPLSKGHFALVDNYWYEAVKDIAWHVLPKGKTFYAVHSEYRKGKTPKLILLHHLIVGFPLTGDVDHINNNGLDCRKINLRFLTHRQNCTNRWDKKAGKTSSKLPGVTWDKSRDLWVAQITINQKHKFLGRFDSQKAAHQAYVKAVEALND